MIRFGKSILSCIDGKTMSPSILPLSEAEIYDFGVLGMVGEPHADIGMRRFTPMSHVLAILELEALPEEPI